MCTGPGTTIPRPRWRALYVRLLAAAGAGALLATSSLAPALRTALGCGLVALAAVTTLAWIRANAAALDQAAWCDCAAATISARVVMSRPRHRQHRRRRRRGATLTV